MMHPENQESNPSDDEMVRQLVVPRNSEDKTESDGARDPKKTERDAVAPNTDQLEQLEGIRKPIEPK
ncbi:hypothetical protein ACN4EK_14090 [Pantanalinema rosaneae CENA516]|uniref:hypothetical protein n=1 Tax=Pantanalinema rosaneae TaxID=1620701 RepID=UPI003D6ECCAA